MGFGGAEAVIVFAPGASGKRRPAARDHGRQHDLLRNRPRWVSTPRQHLRGALIRPEPGDPDLPARRHRERAPQRLHRRSEHRPQQSAVPHSRQPERTLRVQCEQPRSPCTRLERPGNVARFARSAAGTRGFRFPTKSGHRRRSRNIYVANANNNSITVYPPNANRQVTPTNTVAGPNTGLNGSGSLVITP